MASAAAEGPLGLQNPRILFVGGKGGVGKTTTASALALRFADRGDRVLLVSTDPAHSLGDLFDRALGDREIEVAPRLWVMEIDPEKQVVAHLEQVSRSMRDLVRPEMHAEIDRQMKLARLSPGAVEAAMLERVADLMIHAPERYDRLIFDTAPTGHTLRLLSLPEIMAAWTDGLLRARDRSESWDPALKTLAPKGSTPPPGADLAFLDPPAPQEDDKSARIRKVLLERRRKFHEARHLLLDRNVTGFILVLIPEKLPILESQKAMESLGEFGVPVAALVINRVLPEESLGEFLERRREREARYLQQIDSIFPEHPKVRVPLLPEDVQGLEGLRRIAPFLLGES
jgi:arsenite/tail-anchored protein-transporting ATPase